MKPYLLILIMLGVAACESRDSTRKRIIAAADSLEAADSLHHGLANWAVDSTIDPTSGKQVIHASLKSTVDRGSDSHLATLNVRCWTDSVDLTIAWNKPLGANTYVTMRFDSYAPDGLNWDPSENKTETRWPPGDRFALITRLSGTQKFVAQIESSNSGNLTAVFELKGMDRAMEPIVSTCKK